MKKAIKQIVEGWKNHLSPKDEEAMFIAEVSRQRMCICECCIHHSKHHNSVRPDEHCTKCGCTLVAKTKCLSCECPVGKWWAVNKEEYGKEKN